MKPAEIEPVEKLRITGIHYGLNDITGFTTKETEQRAIRWWVFATPHAEISEIEGGQRDLPQSVNWKLLRQKDTFISTDVENPNNGGWG